MNDFECADIHELIVPDLLHQVIKGMFKDHLVKWIEDYINATYKPEAKAKKVLDDIDQQQVQYKVKNFWCTYLINRIGIVPPFSGLWWFPEGHNFKQWTRDDSKALMKVSQRLAQLEWELMFLGVSACYTGLCTGWYYMCTWCISRVLLYITVKFPDRAWFGPIKGCHLTFLSVLWSFYWLWCLGQLLDAKTTFYHALPFPHLTLWSSKWTLFINYRVQAHSSC